MRRKNPDLHGNVPDKSEVALLLDYLEVTTVVLTGIAGNICVLFTANDAYLRDLRVIVPADCIASNTQSDNDAALQVMEKILKADTRASSEVDFTQLRGKAC